MRHFIVICGFACLILSGVFQSAIAEIDTLWTRTYNFGTASSFYAATELQSGGFAAAGFKLNGSFDDAVILKVDPLGDSSWAQVYGEVGSGERAFDIAELNNGTLVICGYSLSTLSCFVAGYTPNGEQLFANNFDPPGASQASAILPAEDGGFWVLSRKNVSGSELDFWLIRCNQNGDSLFSRTFGTPGFDIPDEILPGFDNTLELIGSARDTANDRYSFYQVTTDLDGNFIRQNVIGGPRWEQAFAATLDTTTGDILITGEIRDTVGADRNALAVRLNFAGEELWTREYSGGRLSERIGGVAPYLEGGAMYAGQTGGSVSSSQLWLMSVGSSGDTIWTWTGTETGRNFEDLIRVADGGFIACGRAFIGGYDKGLIWRISPPSGISGIVRDRVTGEVVAGVRVQAAELPQYSLSDTVGRFTLSLPAGNYTLYTGGPCFSGDTLHDIEVIANENTLSDITVGVAHMTMLHSTINVLAPNRSIGHSDLVVHNAGSGDLVYSFESIPLYPAEDWLRVDPPAGRLAPGDSLVAQVIVEADTTDDGTYDYFGQIRLHSNSCPDTLVVIEVLAVILDADETPALPAEFALYPAFPNPFNSTTNLRFGLDRDTNVSLTLYDVTGRQVATLINNQRLAAGEHNVRFQAENLASGLYFVNLKDNSRSQTQRLLYIR